jgi:hypothetical protein
MGTALAAMTNGLHAALLLARGRPDALQFIEPGPGGTARSFWAALICLPAFICLRLMDGADVGTPPQLGHAFALDLLGYVIGWAGFAVLSRSLAVMLHREHRWARYIGVWNWCNVAQYMLLVAAGIPQLLHAPAIIQQAAGLVALGWALWLEWYATRLTLQVGPLAAAGLVATDVLIGVVIAGVTSGLSPN